MPNKGHSINLAAKQIEQPETEAWITSLDMRNAYVQMQINKNAAAATCFFRTFGGEATDSYRGFFCVFMG